VDLFQGMTAENILGITPGGYRPVSQSSAAGEQLPGTSHMAGDKGGSPFHPDSPHFWFMVLGAAAILGVVGASVDVRAGKRHARASVNA
jgi:hypothetical protein